MCSDYLKMGRTRHAKTEWVDIKWKGGVLTHPVQKDGFSCGVLVVMVSDDNIHLYIISYLFAMPSCHGQKNIHIHNSSCNRYEYILILNFTVYCTN